MTWYLLDTNIISNVIKPQPSESLIGWLESQADDDLFISSLTVAEIQRGILEKPPGRKRDALEAWFLGPEGPGSVRRPRAAFRRSDCSGLGAIDRRRRSRRSPA